VLWETVHPDDGPLPPGRALEALMDLSASPDAPPRTERDFATLLGDMGFGDVELVAALQGRTTFLVARKSIGA